MTPLRRTGNPSRSAFTLLELLAVLLIAGSLVGTAVVMLHAPIRQARLEVGRRSVRLLDEQLRTSATPSSSLWLDLDQGTARVQQRGELGTAYDVAVNEIQLRGRRLTSGVVKIPYDAQGASPSFALHWEGPTGQSEWAIVCGGTGQVLELTGDVEDTLRQIH